MIISGVGWGGFLLCFILAFFFLWLAVLDILLWFFYISFFFAFFKNLPYSLSYSVVWFAWFVNFLVSLHNTLHLHKMGMGMGIGWG